MVSPLKMLGNGKRPLKAKLIFNTAAGNQAESAIQLAELLDHLQACSIRPDVFMVHPEDDLAQIARRAVRDGYRMVIASGGDGTIEAVALGLVESTATLGIIPTGTRNNLARSLGIPIDKMDEAVALLRNGRRVRIDVGHIRNRNNIHWFLEAAVVGLGSALYPAADNIQHGDLGKVTELISTFVTHTPSEIRLKLDDHVEFQTSAHMVLVANMPYMGGNFQIAPDIQYDDRRLDVFVYSNLSKLDLIGHALQLSNGVSDPRVQRYQVKKLTITTNPEMPMMADGVMLNNGPLKLDVRPRGLVVMAGTKEPPEPVPELVPDTASAVEP